MEGSTLTNVPIQKKENDEALRITWLIQTSVPAGQSKLSDEEPHGNTYIHFRSKNVSSYNEPNVYKFRWNMPPHTGRVFIPPWLGPTAFSFFSFFLGKSNTRLKDLVVRLPKRQQQIRFSQLLWRPNVVEPKAQFGKPQDQHPYDWQQKGSHVVVVVVVVGGRCESPRCVCVEGGQLEWIVVWLLTPGLWSSGGLYYSV